MDKSIEYIHNNKLAIPNKKYFGKDGTVYIGLPNKRLKFLESTIITKQEVEFVGISTETNGETYSVYIEYDIDKDVEKIKYFGKEGLVKTKTLIYNINKDIIQIITSGKENYSQDFNYDIDGDITHIPIKY